MPSRLSSRFSASTIDSQRHSVESSELTYQELSIDNELFTAPVYKRNYRNYRMQFDEMVEIPIAPPTLKTNRRPVAIYSGISAVSGHATWGASVHYEIANSTPKEQTVRGPWFELLLPHPRVRDAINTWNAETLSETLSKNKDHFNEWKQCMLYEACKQAKPTLVQVLLNYGVWVDGYRPSGNTSPLTQTTPLHVAAYSSSIETVQILLDERPAMKIYHMKDVNGYEPLHVACRIGPLQKIALLIKAGASLDCESDITKERLVHSATKFHGTTSDILTYLLEHGADPRVQDAQGNTPLHLVSMDWDRNDRLPELLKMDPPLHVKNNLGRTPLHVACGHGTSTMVKKLLEAGSPFGMRDKEDRSPLQIACTRGDLSIIKSLLDAQNFVDRSEIWTQSPLLAAVSGFNFPAVACLLTYGYDVNTACPVTGKNLLQHAFSQACSSVFSYINRMRTILTLLNFGVNARIEDHDGNNVLHHWGLAKDSLTTLDHALIFQEQQKCLSLAGILVQNGAEVDAVNCHGETPMDIAVREDNMPLAHLLQAISAASNLSGSDSDTNTVFSDEILSD